MSDLHAGSALLVGADFCQLQESYYTDTPEAARPEERHGIQAHTESHPLAGIIVITMCVCERATARTREHARTHPPRACQNGRHNHCSDSDAELYQKVGMEA